MVPDMRIQLSPLLTVTLKHSYCLQDGQIYWQRKLPKRHLERYPSTAPLKRNLFTRDPLVAAQKIARLDREHEALWKAMDNDPALTPTSAREAASRILKAHGIENPRNTDPALAEQFFDRLEEKRIAYAEAQHDPEETYRTASEADFLNKPEVDALQMLQGRTLFLFSDAIEVYLTEHQNAGKATFTKTEAFTRTCCTRFIKLLGDKELTAYTRDDAKTFRDNLLASDLKTASVKRTMTPVCATFRKAIAEKQLAVTDIWTRLSIAGLGEDSNRRPSVTHDESARLRIECKAADDDIRWLVALHLDVGARIAEVAGLALEDIHPDALPVPYVEFRPTTGRTLKGESSGHTFSRRKVPLVGAALWAAQRIHAKAKPGQVFAFPRYLTKAGTVKSDSASAAVNKWLSAQDFPFTSHSFRHAMKDRLRNANAPLIVQNEIGGWARASMAEGYGEGTALGILHGYLLQSLATAHGATSVLPTEDSTQT